MIPGWGRSPGGGNGNPLQYSCLENPIDRGAWRAPVHWVAESWTQLKGLQFSSPLLLSPGPFIPLGPCWRPGLPLPTPTPRTPCQPGLCQRHHPAGLCLCAHAGPTARCALPTCIPAHTAGHLCSPPCGHPGPSCCASWPCWRPATAGRDSLAAAGPAAARGQRVPYGGALQPLQCSAAAPVLSCLGEDLLTPDGGLRVLRGCLQAPALWAIASPWPCLPAGRSPHIAGCRFPFSGPMCTTAATLPVC